MDARSAREEELFRHWQDRDQFWCMVCDKESEHKEEEEDQSGKCRQRGRIRIFFSGFCLVHWKNECF